MRGFAFDAGQRRYRRHRRLGAARAAAVGRHAAPIVLGCFTLLDMPVGAALGICTLSVLLPARSEEEYRQISRVA